MIKRMVAFFSLFGSLATLLCCALPATLVALGLGGVFASLMGAVPQLTWVSYHKTFVFAAAGLLLVGGGVMQWYARFEPCPTDPTQAAACMSARRWSAIIYWASIALYAVGFFFAFILPALNG